MILGRVFHPLEDNLRITHYENLDPDYLLPKSACRAGSLDQQIVFLGNIMT